MKVVLSIALVFLTLGCGESDSDDQDSGSEGGGDTLTIGDAEDETSGVGIAISDIESTQENAIPGSLEIDDSALRVLQTDDPCAGLEFFACQPNLIKLYLDLAKGFIGMLRQTLVDTRDLINALEIGEGTVPVDDDESLTEIAYNVASRTEYKLRASGSGGPALYLDVNTTEDTRVYDLRIDGNVLGLVNEDDEGPPPILKISLAYQSEDNFNFKFTMGGTECDPDDVRAPKNISISIVKESGLHRGKAMLYMPIWRVGDEEANCDYVPNENSEMFIYTDFAGNDTQSTANFYMLQRSVEVAAFGDFSFADFCDNFSESCGSGNTAFGGVLPVTNFANPACVTLDDVTYNDACSNIAVSEFSDSENWTDPSDLVEPDGTLPEI